MISPQVLDILFRLPALAIGIGLHEFAHAWTAWKLGDSTPEDDGRLSLNPLDHLDPLGTMMIFIGPIGWGRSVRVDPTAFRNPTRDMMRVALAGPLTNFVICSFALSFTVIVFGPDWVLSVPDGAVTWQKNLATVLNNIIILNLVLGLFNLLPIPPLDGHKIFRAVIPASWAVRLDMAAGSPLTILLILVVAATGSFTVLLLPALAVLSLIVMGGVVPSLLASAVSAGAWLLLYRSLEQSRRGEDGAENFTVNVRRLIGGGLVLAGLVAVGGGVLGQRRLMNGLGGSGVVDGLCRARVVDVLGRGTAAETVVLDIRVTPERRVREECLNLYLPDDVSPGDEITVYYRPGAGEGERVFVVDGPGRRELSTGLILCIAGGVAVSIVGLKILRVL